MVCDDGRVVKSVPVVPIVDRSNRFESVKKKFSKHDQKNQHYK